MIINESEFNMKTTCKLDKSNDRFQTGSNNLIRPPLDRKLAY